MTAANAPAADAYPFRTELHLVHDTLHELAAVAPKSSAKVHEGVDKAMKALRDMEAGLAAQFARPAPATEPAPDAANEGGLSDYEIMQEWDRHRQQGEKGGTPLLRVIVGFARHWMVRPGATTGEPGQSLRDAAPFYFTARQAEILRDGLRLVQYNPRRHDDIATAERMSRYLTQPSGYRPTAVDAPDAAAVRDAELDDAACWSCKRTYTAAKRADADGNCPHCGVEIELDDNDLAGMAKGVRSPATTGEPGQPAANGAGGQQP